MTDEDLMDIETRATNSDYKYKQDLYSLLSEVRRLRKPVQVDLCVLKVQQAWGILAERNFGVDLDEDGELTQLGIEELYDLLPNYVDEMGLDTIPSYAKLPTQEKRSVRDQALDLWLQNALKSL